MLFKNKKCESCNETYDPTEEYCPYCHSKNESLELVKRGKGILWLPSTRQILLFITGLVGLQIVSSIVAIILARIFNYTAESPTEIKIQVVTLTNAITYCVLFILLGIIIFPYLKKIFVKFKKVTPYVAGIIFGIGIIVLSIVYANLVPSKVNENESIVRLMTKNYPALSVIILCFIGPICEELTYRVGLFSFSARINRITAYIITIIVFAFIHFDFTSSDIANEFINLPSYVIGGLGLSLAYDLFGLPASITAHVVNNLFSVIMIIISNN